MSAIKKVISRSYTANHLAVPYGFANPADKDQFLKDLASIVSPWGALVDGQLTVIEDASAPPGYRSLQVLLSGVRIAWAGDDIIQTMSGYIVVNMYAFNEMFVLAPAELVVKTEDNHA